MPAGKDGEGGDALDGEEGGERHCGVGVCFCHEQKEGDGCGAAEDEEAEPGEKLFLFHCCLGFRFLVAKVGRAGGCVVYKIAVKVHKIAVIGVLIESKLVT